MRTIPFAQQAAAVSASEPKSVAERAQLLGGIACCLDLLCGNGQLDEGREESRTLYAIVRVVGERAVELTQADARLSLGQPEQRQAGLRLSPGLRRSVKPRSETLT